jgi:hypothetical protein
MESNQRELEARRSLDLLGLERFNNFVESVRGLTDPMAVRLFVGGLDAGESIEDLFFTGEELGYELSAKKLGTSRYRIAFGCVAGPLAGDGGQWEALFNDEGAVVEVSSVSLWMA